MNSNYQPVVGLEVHVELKTKSKMFCQCAADYFSKPPNTNTCPVCLGLPGALPVPNQKAIAWTVLIGKALHCTINVASKFDRKHYFYPDLAKGYQISQYDEPIAVRGWLQLEKGGKKFRIHRVHLEEDTGKLVHQEKDTLVDFNRSGVPLVEIVTEPDFDNVEDVKRFLEELHTIIRYLDVSDADMEKGTMRMEPNISVRITQNSKFELPKYKVEVKNINSFNFVKRAIDYEVKRHIELFEQGKTPVQETRGWDSDHNRTYSQRSKEEAHDYRYFPEPDIPPLRLTEGTLTKLAKNIPEMPTDKLARYVDQMHIKTQDAYQLTREKKIADYFETVLVRLKDLIPQQVANVIINKKIATDLPVEEFVRQAKQLFAPKVVDEAGLTNAINQVLATHGRVVADYRAGKQNAIMFLVGQVMKEMKGKADAKSIIEKLKTQMSKLKSI